MANDEKDVIIQFKRTLPNAVIPTKANKDAEGYDLTVVAVDKIISEKCIMFDTGIAVQPPPGYHTRVVPRSSFGKSIYVMANSIGIIDRDYRGSIKICVKQVEDDEMIPIHLVSQCASIKSYNDIRTKLKPPFKAFQLLVEKSIPSRLVEVENLDDTKRGDGGFGSTG